MARTAFRLGPARYCQYARRCAAAFGRSYAAEPDVLVEQLQKDEAIAEADILLLTIPNQLGVAYNVHILESILTTVTLKGAHRAEDVTSIE